MWRKMKMITSCIKAHEVTLAGSGSNNLGQNSFQATYAVFMIFSMLVQVHGNSSIVLLASPTISHSLSDVNASVIHSNMSDFGNLSSSIQPNSTYVLSSVMPSIISQVSNNTATAENVFFLEFKLLSKEWSVELTSKTARFISLANEITEKISEVYSSKNDSSFNGSLVLGYREGIYVSVKVEYRSGVTINVSLVDPLIDYFRTGGSDGFLTDTVFIKLSKYADCIISYVDTRICYCRTKTYKQQIKCAEPDVIGGDVCPQKCYNGYQITGTTPCTWDDLDAFLCHSSESCQPVIMTVIIASLLSFAWNI